MVTFMLPLPDNITPPGESRIQKDNHADGEDGISFVMHPHNGTDCRDKCRNRR